MSKKLKCVMLVDDDHLTNFLNKIIIDKAGITDHIQRCESVQSALRYLASGLRYEADAPLPELIILDMSMPEASGWKFFDYYNLIKDSFPRPPVIVMLTSLGNAKDEMDASNMPGLSGFFAKPLTHELLNKIITGYDF